MGTYGAAGLGLLGDPTRRAIFERLAQRPRSVGELADELPVSRPAVSQHLRALKDAGPVTDTARGRWTWPRRCWRRRRAVAGTNAVSTVASATGAGCSPSNRRTGSC